MTTIGIRREDKSPFEKRCPLTPDHIRRAISEYGVDFVVQPAPLRIFKDEEFTRAGATVSEDLSKCDVVLGVKEIPKEKFEEGKAYVFFSHTAKAQSYNMDMLSQLLERNCSLVDYERISDVDGRRLVFFGYYAGLAGMLESLWSLGQRLDYEGKSTPFSKMKRAWEYEDLADARKAVAQIATDIRRLGLPESVTPLVFGITGYGNVAKGAMSVLDELPVIEISPEDLACGNFPNNRRRNVYKVVFKEEDLVERKDGGEFNLQEYYDTPELYNGVFEDRLDQLSVLVNCIYWEEKYPRLMSLAKTKAMYSGQSPKLKVVGDISCDIDGSVQATTKATTVQNPVFVYDVDKEESIDGVEGNGPVIMAVDILPAELPKEASRHFGDSLYPFLLQLGTLDASLPFSRAEIMPEIRKALIVWGGELTPEYSYLEDHI